MVQADREIAALLRLIDDPDDEIYNTVVTKLMDYGKDIIPNLEHFWEITEDNVVQRRIESLIHRVHFTDLKEEFISWKNEAYPELLKGIILLARYRFPELNIPNILTQFEQIRRNIWMELNNFLNPLEQVNVINTILFNFYKFHGHELTEREPKYFFINHVLESRQGNAYSIGIIYLALCELLDIPIFAIELPRQFVFAYIVNVQNYLFPEQPGIQQIQFFIDPVGGMVYTRRDIDVYLKKLNAEPKEKYFLPINNRKILFYMMEELALCYRYNREEQKADEIQLLMRLLNDHE